MKIYIPTRNRTETQTTWDYLGPECQKYTYLVCPIEEKKAHEAAGRQVLVRPPNLNLSGTRAWLCDTAPQSTILMLDDDLKFFSRVTPDVWNLRRAEFDEVANLMSRLYNYVDSKRFAHAGLSPRQLNNQHFPATEKYVTRMNAVHVVDRDILALYNIRYDDMELMQDYHVTLSLLERGYPNVQVVDNAWDQTGGSAAEGGCSDYRTMAAMERAAHRLAELHPGSVSVVVKRPKKGWANGWEERTDVRIGWRKTYDRALDRKLTKEATGV